MGRINGKPLKGVRALRARTRLNQREFWLPLGVTQSGGSRYEGGRAIPKPLQQLIKLRHGTVSQLQRDLTRLRRGVSVPVDIVVRPYAVSPPGTRRTVGG